MGRVKTKLFGEFDKDLEFCFSDNEKLVKKIWNQKICLEIWTGNWRFFSYLVKNNQDLFCIWCDLRKDRLIKSKRKVEELVKEKNNNNCHLEGSEATKDPSKSEWISKSSKTSESLDSSTSSEWQITNSEWKNNTQEWQKCDLEWKINKNNYALSFWDARELLDFLPNESVEKFYMNFPDPRPPKWEWKYRFFQLEVLEILHKKMVKWWKIYIKTDDYEYFYFTRTAFFFKKKLFREDSHSKDVYKEQNTESEKYICTEFEEKWLEKWKKIFELIFEKK